MGLLRSHRLAGGGRRVHGHVALRLLCHRISRRIRCSARIHGHVLGSLTGWAGARL